MLVSGLFNSCAKPPIICPIAASRSLWMICCSSFFSTVISRTETMTPFNFAARRTTDSPTPALSANSHRGAALVFAKAEHLSPRVLISVERQKFAEGPVLLRRFFSNQVFWLVAQQITDTGTHETVALFQVDDQDQVRETFQQVSLKFFLLRSAAPWLRRSVYLPGFPIPNDLPGCIPNCTGSVEESGLRAISAPQSHLAGAYSAFIVRGAPQHWALFPLEVQGVGPTDNNSCFDP